MKKSCLIGLLCMLIGSLGFAQTGVMNVPDIKGGANVKGYENWISIEGFHLSMEKAVPTTGAGRTRNTVNYANVGIEKQIDRASTYLMKATQTGKVFSKVELIIPKLDNPNLQMHYTFEKVSFQHYDLMINATEELEKLTFSYETLTLVVTERLSNGRKVQHESVINRATGR